ncbi:MAG: 30S ribosomal protein S9 [Dehalococcoidales bacterium]|nr:30S ribosomal protein S9 [Dehalococcoidales bacterium]
MNKQTYYSGTGRRKTAIAQVKLTAGNGAIIVNNRPFEEWLPNAEERLVVIKPLIVTENAGKFNATVKVIGGGLAGQRDAISHGIARALQAFDDNLKTVLRQHKLLTRDPRAKERKKAGLKRARKAPQYTKR